MFTEDDGMFTEEDDTPTEEDGMSFKLKGSLSCTWAC
jgi:hypothetical protein